MKKRVADIIMDVLVEKGIRDCFAVVGGGAMFLDNALLHKPELNKYFNHHEQACAMAAEGYVRASGRMAMVCVTSGPGGTNTLTGVMGAWVDSLPMIVVSGQVRYAISVPKTGLKLRTRGVQEFNIVDTVKTMTKYAKLVIDPLDVKMEIEKALDIANSGRKGPVWLDIPQDVQSAVVDTDDLREYVPEGALSASCDVTPILDAVKAAKRPVFLAGAGITTTHSRALFRRLCEQLGVPAVASFNGSDAVCRESDYCFGPIGPCGQRSANIIVQNSDLVVAFGCAMGFPTTGFAQENFAPNARIISIDIDEEEMKKPGLNYWAQYRCDVVDALRQMLALPGDYRAPEGWMRYCRDIKARFSPYEAAQGKAEDARVCSYVFWQRYFSKAAKDAILVLGNNSAITSALQVGNMYGDQHILTNFNCGSMGYDLPAALGASVALDREVILATGDGSFMMNLQELQTIAHHQLPVKVLLFENQGYNAIRQTSKNFFNGELIGCTAETGVSFPSFEKVADVFGFKYIHCAENRDIDRCLDAFFDAKGPTIMEISQLIDDPVSPKVMSRIDENGVMTSPALHDMFPFLPKETLDDLMIQDKE